MYTAQKNNKKLKALYEQSLHIKSAIPHPLIMGVIRGMNVYLTDLSHCVMYMCCQSFLLHNLCLFGAGQSVVGRCI